jgi:hypothetical protein
VVQAVPSSAGGERDDRCLQFLGNRKERSLGAPMSRVIARHQQIELTALSTPPPAALMSRKAYHSHVPCSWACFTRAKLPRLLEFLPFSSMLHVVKRDHINMVCSEQA